MREDLADALKSSSMSAAERLHLLELCHPRSAEELTRDGDRIDAHVGALRKLAETDPTIDVALAGSIADALHALIEDRHRMTFEERRLLCGAIDYFATVGDTADDVGDLRGLDDDARIIRAVCSALGRGDIARTL